MILITTHLNADFDGLASMVAARKLYPGAVLAFPGGAQEPVRRFLGIHDVGITKLKDLRLSEVTRLVLVDVQGADRLGSLKSLCEHPDLSVHVYDHHPHGEQESEAESSPRPELRLVEPVGATTTLLNERLREENIPLTSFEATVMALGLYEETGSLAFASTTPRDLDAAAHLLRAGADLNVVTDFLRIHVDPDQIALLNDLLQSSETYYLEGCKVLLAAGTNERYRGDLAEVVHRLAEIEGLDAVFAAIAMDEKVEVIGRSRRPAIDVAQVARAFGGGGHAVAASASVKGRTVVEIKEELARLLTGRFRPSLSAKAVMTRPVKAIGQDTTIQEAERVMTRFQVNVLPVLNGRSRYLGLLSRETVQKALFHKFGKVKAVDLIQIDAYSASPETPFREIESNMLERNQRFVPILEKERVVGVITRTDLLRTLHDDVLASARVRGKGEEPPPFAPKRNIGRKMEERLPERIVALLKLAGQIAERTGVSALVVGGFVRDLLLGRKNFDVDFVIEGDGVAFAKLLAKETQGRVIIHNRFGTAIVVTSDRFKCDVATARTEYYEYPTALPTVEESSIKKDLYRRDFTINALAIRLNSNRFGELIDFYGGLRDLNEKTLRVLHSLSFVDDPTRVFRAVRFELRFGFRLGKETLALIKGAVKMELFHRLSASRLYQELLLLLSEEEPRQAVIRMGELGLLAFIHPALTMAPHVRSLLKRVEETLGWHKLLFLDRKMESWVVYLIALLAGIPGQAVKEAISRLRIPERHAKKIRSARFRSAQILRHLAKRPQLRPAGVSRLLEGLSDETLLFLMADSKAASVKRQISSYLTTYQKVKPLLTGNDLKAMGLKPGPEFRRILDRLRDSRLNGEVNTEAEERELMKRVFKK